MAGHIHAIILLACPVATMAVLRFAKRRLPTDTQKVRTICLTVVLLTIAWICSVSTWDWFDGSPRFQWILPGVCVFFAHAFVENRMLRRSLVVCLVVAMFGLSKHYSRKVAHGKWTSRLPYRTYEWECTLKAETALSKLAAYPGYEDLAYEECWLRDLPIWPELVEIGYQLPVWPQTFRLAGSGAVVEGFPWPLLHEPHREWHTWFTGIIWLEPIQADYWYCGGPIATADIELRDG